MLPPLLGVPGEVPEGQLDVLITSQQICRDLLFMSCPLHIALALAEVQMCPALAKGKWPRPQQTSLWVHEGSTGLPELTGGMKS